MLATLLSVLRGRPADVSGPTVVRITRLTTVTAIIVANAVGAALTILLLTLVLPAPDEVTGSTSVLRNTVAVGTIVPLVFLLGLRAGLRAGTRASTWLLEGRAPDPRERRAVLRLPLKVFWIQARMWFVATVVVTSVNLTIDPLFAFEVGITILMSGLATAAVGYLLTVRTSRALVARALADRAPERSETSGVRVRALLTWALATGIPVAGALVLAAIAIGLDEVTKSELGLSVVVLAGIALVVGLLATTLFARSVADPLRELRDALTLVEQGDLGVSVAVNDATEVGSVQAGFNQMVAGLRERERVRDLFGRHVGEDVAHQALEDGVALGGEEREAAALFVDVVGSTTIATERSPTEVVELLNAFFAVVVDVTGTHGGFVNKFAGDGALCVFGAPLGHDDPAGAALGAAREMQDRLRREVPEAPAVVGVSAGVVVAGNVGAADRLEYTVIGDPVNEAARLTELAKDHESGVCASEAALTAVRDSDERARWMLGEAVVLRGRGEATRVAVPA